MSEAENVFEADNASAYDERAASLAPIKDALHLACEQLLRNLPDDTNVLCVGAGTGAEIDYLARLHAGWHFTAVDPAADMLAQCEEKAGKAGYLDRLSLHAGTLVTLPEGAPFDLATSFLVSHFMHDRAERRAYFQSIASRLNANAILLNVDLSTDETGEVYENSVSRWVAMAQRAGFPMDRNSFNDHVSLLAPNDLANLIAEARFTTPEPFFQFLLMRGWIARRSTF